MDEAYIYIHSQKKQHLFVGMTLPCNKAFTTDD